MDSCQNYPIDLFQSQLPHTFFYEFGQTIRSSKTREIYLGCIRKFLIYIRDHFGCLGHPRDLKPLHVMRFINDLRNPQVEGQKPLAPKSIIQHLAALKKFSIYLMYYDYIDKDLTALVPRPKDTVIRPTESLTPQEVKILFDQIKPENSNYYLHKALVAILFGTCMRRSEVIQLRRKDFITKSIQIVPGIDESAAYFYYKDKGGEYKTIRLHTKIAQYTNDYLRFLKLRGIDLDMEAYLFSSVQRWKEPDFKEYTPLSPWGINNMLKKYAKMAGIKKRISPHVGKKTAINAAIDAGLDLLEVAQFAQHKSLKTTQKYIEDKNRLENIDAALKLSYLD